MKRSDLKLGETYAYRRSTYGGWEKAEVLTLDPLVPTTVPKYSHRRPEDRPIALPDGTTVMAPAQEPQRWSKPSDLRVLARLTWDVKDGEETAVRLVAAREIHGTYAEVMAKLDAKREAERQVREAEAEEARRRKERVQRIAARLEAAVPGATLRALHDEAQLPLDAVEALLTRAGV